MGISVETLAIAKKYAAGGGDSGIKLDKTLSKNGYAADAKAAGDRIEELSSEVKDFIAGEFDESVFYDALSYVWRDGLLYRIDGDHPQNVTWENTPHTEVVLGNELSNGNVALQVEKLERMAADNNLKDVTDDLKNATNKPIHSIAVADRYNLFDKSNPLNVVGKYFTPSGSIGTGNERNAHTHPIWVTPGTYQFKAYAGNFGVNAGKVVVVVNSDGTPVSPVEIISASYVDSSNEHVVFTIEKPCFISLNYNPQGELIVAPQSVFFEAGLPYAANALAKKSELDAVYQELYSYFIRGGNLFDKSSSLNTPGQYYGLQPWKLNTGQSGNYFTSHPILVSPGEYKFNGISTFGLSAGVVAVVDANGNMLNRFLGTFGSDYIVTFTVPQTCFISVNFTAANRDTLVLCRSDAWTGNYVPYSAPKIDQELLDLSGMVVEADTTFFNEIHGANLFDKRDQADWIEGKFFKTNTPDIGTLQDYTNYAIVSGYIKLDGAGTYCTTRPRLYGTGGHTVTLYNSSKEYVDYSKGTLRANGDVCVFSVSQSQINNGAYYVGLTWVKGTEPVFMLVKSAEYPTGYKAYDARYDIPDLDAIPKTAPNRLYNKTVLFDGDSICDIINSGSYSVIIGADNDMAVHNFAVSGGTLTSGLYSGSSARHWVSDNVDAMAQLYPDADYVIFEGGTNDADLIGSILDGNVPAGFGSFDPNDFSGNYDAETFCGAVETIIYKAMQYWPHAKIGFVIAMKMGLTTNYDNRYAYFQKLMEICEKWGMPYVNLWDNCPMNPKLLSCYDPSMTAAENAAAGKLYQDGQHPTKAGYERIAPIIEAWMRTL